MSLDGSPHQMLTIERPEGAVAYVVSGSGPLVVCIPGMGDLRSSYRYVQPELLAGGYRVAVTDLRGHGDSDHTFTQYGDLPTAGDIEALVRELGGPALLVANSLAAGAAVLVAAHHPELVSGLILIGPFVRGPATSSLTRLATKVLLAPRWAAASWDMYLPKLYAGAKPDDFARYRTSVSAAMKRPGYAKAFSLTTRTRHDDAEQALASVTAPTLVVMGERDPDFPGPSAEARWITDQLCGDLLMVPDAGHYPQSQRSDLVGPAVTGFAGRVYGAPGAGGSG